MQSQNLIIVDDELPALRNMQYALDNHPQWNLLASCASCAQARDVMQRQKVDLVLLDIEMPEQNGLDFARQICQAENPPLIVFITAYDQHAISAFDVFALDYLLKPFDDERFAQMLARAQQTLQLKQKASANASLQTFFHERDELDAGHAFPSIEQIVIRSIGSVEKIEIAEVVCLRAAANYVEIFLANRSVLHRATISAMEERLPAGQFMRLHRTTIARISAIASLKLASDGGYCANLSNGQSVRVSERYLKDVKKLFA